MRKTGPAGIPPQLIPKGVVVNRILEGVIDRFNSLLNDLFTAELEAAFYTEDEAVISAHSKTMEYLIYPM